MLQYAKLQWSFYTLEMVNGSWWGKDHWEVIKEDQVCVDLLVFSVLTCFL